MDLSSHPDLRAGLDQIRAELLNDMRREVLTLMQRTTGAPSSAQGSPSLHRYAAERHVAILKESITVGSTGLADIYANGRYDYSGEDNTPVHEDITLRLVGGAGVSLSTGAVVDAYRIHGIWEAIAVTASAGSPLTVTWTPAVTEPPELVADGFFTVSVSGLRWTAETNPVYPYDITIGGDLDPTQGVFPDKEWTFAAPSIPNFWAYLHIGYIYPDAISTPYAYPNEAAHKEATDDADDGGGLRFALSFPLGDADAIADTSDGTNLDLVVRDGQFHQLAIVQLLYNGAHTIPSDLGTPHVTYQSHPPGSKTHMRYVASTRTLYVVDLGRGDIDTVSTQHSPSNSLVIPVGTEDIVQLAPTESGPFYMGLRNDGAIDWDDDYPLQLCAIKTNDDGDLVYLHPYTERMHYRPPPRRRTCLGKILSKIDADSYFVDVYEDGFFDDDGAGKSATSVGAIAYISQTHADDVIPANSVVYLVRCSDHWEFQVPVWL